MESSSFTKNDWDCKIFNRFVGSPPFRKPFHQEPKYGYYRPASIQ